ncbi:MAG: hypothetical protein C0614_09285 [Desulfuromonas sp.]|nr:MAG: hypothetical protein C0614_09285 [Desulfuromonas sp.]
MLLVISSMQPSLAGLDLIPGLSKMDKAKEYWREHRAERNEDFIFYGRVVDLDGVPVQGALVRMESRLWGVESGSAFRNYQATTDSKGNFTIGGYGELIGLLEITRDGYLYRFEYNRSRVLLYGKHVEKKGPGYGSQEPMVFKMRKKADLALVNTYGMGWLLRTDGYRLVDLYRMDMIDDANMMGAFRISSIFRDWHPDISIKLEGEPGQYRLVLEALDPESGFAQIDVEYPEQMTLAPEQGYQPRIVVPIGHDEFGQVTAYVRNAGGLFYSAISLRYNHVPVHRYVECNIGARTNLVGDRKLEPGLYEEYERQVKGKESQPLRRGDLPLLSEAL